VAEPRKALERGRDLAGASGLVLATGSIYLVADLLAGNRRLSASNL
jgi:dihydrofolate synthase/folylpolyglutamate synthase